MDRLSESPFGVAWGFLYGYPAAQHGGKDTPPAVFMPELRRIGASHTKIYLFWQQIEPEAGRFDWRAVDTFLEQLKSADEALIAVYSSSTWATRLPRPLLPPSPAKSPEDYYRFIYTLVRRCRGRIRYWQNDCEPNNPIFWAGTTREFIAQLEVFHRAVKEADPEAVVVCGGYDGLFRSPDSGMPPLAGQEAGLTFFDSVFEQGRRFFDVFDLRLYGDPYSIPERIRYMRRRMERFGSPKPILCSEYHGPGFFDFPSNGAYAVAAHDWSSSLIAADAEGYAAGTASMRDRLGQMYDHRDALPPQTQMFLRDCSPELQAKLERMQCRDLVMRNVLALSSGVIRTLYWDLCHDDGDPGDITTLMFGKHRLMRYEEGRLRRYPMADAFQRMTESLDGVESVVRVPLEHSPSIYLFEAQRRARESVFVLWERREAFSGEDAPDTVFVWPGKSGPTQAMDVFGRTIPLLREKKGLRVPVSATPLFLGGTREKDTGSL